jgi:endogenous inhibitor of DNA gyrase (YacG/DUF329 family)
MICPHCGKEITKKKKNKFGNCQAIVIDYWTKKSRPCKFKAIQRVKDKNLCGTHIRYLKTDK